MGAVGLLKVASGHSTNFAELNTAAAFNWYSSTDSADRQPASVVGGVDGVAP